MRFYIHAVLVALVSTSVMDVVSAVPIKANTVAPQSNSIRRIQLTPRNVKRPNTKSSNQKQRRGLATVPAVKPSATKPVRAQPRGLAASQKKAAPVQTSKASTSQAKRVSLKAREPYTYGDDCSDCDYDYDCDDCNDDCSDCDYNYNYNYNYNCDDCDYDYDCSDCDNNDCSDCDYDCQDCDDDYYDCDTYDCSYDYDCDNC